jgi:hypothetical protein
MKQQTGVRTRAAGILMTRQTATMQQAASGKHTQEDGAKRWAAGTGRVINQLVQIQQYIQD